MAILGVLCLGPAIPVSAQPHGGFELTYELHAKGLVIGRTEVSLTTGEHSRYSYTSHTAATGLAALVHDDRIIEQSRFEMHDGTLKPLWYSYEREGKRKRRSVKVNFDWRRGLALNTAKGRTWKMTVLPQTLDKLNYILAVMADLGESRRRLRYSVADGGKLKVFTIQHLGTETIETLLGPTETVVLQRTRKSGKRVTTLWCADAIGYAPIRIKHQETDGEELFLKLTSYKGQVRSPVRPGTHMLP